jgi:dipeptidyl aminopeptidase/acylaminoacyl peptidase
MENGYHETAKGGPLSLVPTGAGEARQLTHDSVSYGSVRFLPDGKRLLASGIEAGHGGRDYLIDVSTGDSKPVTPEGIAGKRGIWPLEGGGFHAIPGLEANYGVIGWTPDGQSVYVVPTRGAAKALKVSRVNVQTGKMEPWKTFGEEAGAGVSSLGRLHLSSDGTAYAYIYVRVLSEAYVVTGLK